MTAAGSLGKHGEAVAGAHLTDHGYAIVDTNWHCPQGEVDIVAREGDIWVFVEVRSRRAGAQSAFESIGPRKQARMIAAAYEYLSAHDLDDCHWRIDVIAVAFVAGQTPVVEHVENALDW